MARSAGVEFKVARAGKSIMGSMTSGEGLLNTFEGTGTVLIAPVANLHQSLIDRCRAPIVPQGPSHSTVIIGKLISCAGTTIGLLIIAIVGLYVAFKVGWLKSAQRRAGTCS